MELFVVHGLDEPILSRGGMRERLRGARRESTHGRQRMLYTGRRGTGYGTRPHGWKPYELGIYEKPSVVLCLCVLALCDPCPSSPASMNVKQACRIMPSSHCHPRQSLGKACTISSPRLEAKRLMRRFEVHNLGVVRKDLRPHHRFWAFQPPSQIQKSSEKCRQTINGGA